jgi:hypothetical protein
MKTETTEREWLEIFRTALADRTLRNPKAAWNWISLRPWLAKIAKRLHRRRSVVENAYCKYAYRLGWIHESCRSMDDCLLLDDGRGLKRPYGAIYPAPKSQ